MRGYLLLISVLLLWACAAPREDSATAKPGTASPPGARVPPTAPAAKSSDPKLSAAALALLAKHNLKPIPNRALNARAQCSFRDEMGYGGRLDLDVQNASVKRLDAQIDIPNHGACRFALGNFQQTASLPTVVLNSRSSSCVISLWEQGEQVTVAFRHCRKECEADAVDYLWPILVDNQNGQCS